ncbi:MAG: PHP domain-containing protein [Chloroflexi bacterium]|nr:PHP domain-containing protein [Chloroflexota bacterium]
MLIDLHTHTYPKSDDSFLEPEQLIGRAREVGLDGICLTEHDGFWDAETAEALTRRFNFLVLPGCEVTTEEGHLLAFGVDRYIFGMHRASFVKELVDRAGGVLVVAHPYRRKYREEEARDEISYDGMVRRACENIVFPLADAVEVMNGRGSARENAFAHEIGKRFGLKGTGASDAHRWEDIGTFATEFEAPIGSLSDLIREIKGGRFRPVALRAPWQASVLAGKGRSASGAADSGS